MAGTLSSQNAIPVSNQLWQKTIALHLLMTVMQLLTTCPSSQFSGNFCFRRFFLSFSLKRCLPPWEPYIMENLYSSLIVLHNLLKVLIKNATSIFYVILLYILICALSTDKPDFYHRNKGAQTAPCQFLIYFVVDCLNLKNLICELAHIIIEMYPRQDNIHIL